MQNNFAILIDTEYIGIKHQSNGVIYRCAFLVYDLFNAQVVEEYDLWCNYNLYKMYPDTRLWSSQLRWLNNNEKYNAGYVIKPFYKTGQSIKQVRHLLYNLVGKYGVRCLYCKGPTSTDALLSRLPLIDIAAPSFEENHEPLKELYFYKNFI